jgi:putative glutamine amidotransferase
VETAGLAVQPSATRRYNQPMRPRIAIPIPHSTDHEYSERAVAQYERAVTLAGADPRRIPLDQTAADVKMMMERCDGVLLPGSNADVDPARFHAPRSPRTATADPRRDAVDDLLLDDAYQLRKPILGICYGLQSLNVYRQGSLIQHIPDFLPEETRTKVNHAAGKTIAVAHAVEITADSKLAGILRGDSRSRLSGRANLGGESGGNDTAAQKPEAEDASPLKIPVNSSHHQSADVIGNGLRIVARCPDDDIIEALEGTSPDHFVLAVQWHPERSVDDDDASRAIFRALVKAATR